MANTALATWQDFESGLRQREAEFAAMLPQHVSRAKFYAVAIAAVKQTPELLQCTMRSLFSAVTKAAQDGLLPDGREGVIQPYNTKVSRKGEPDRWNKIAQWMPMAHGLRKRAKELDGVIVDAQVVYANDKFSQEQGDEPKLIHTPAALGQPRGVMVGAYAIFKREDGTVLHREVMPADMIEKTRKKSKSPDSLMWKDFPEEGYRKTVLRRGIKSVPVSEKLESIVRRDDEMFTFLPAAPDDAVQIANAPPRPERKNGQQRKSDDLPSDGLVVEGEFEETEQDMRDHDDQDGSDAGQEAVAPQQQAQVPQQDNAAFDDDARADLGAGVRPHRVLAQIQAELDGMKADDNFEAFKKDRRKVIDALTGLSEDERDVLRGNFTAMILEAQKKFQPKRGK